MLIFTFLLLVYCAMSKSIVTMPKSCKYKYNGNFYWKICKSSDLYNNKLGKIIFNNYPICVTRDNNNTAYAISDICLHRSASLSSGSTMNDGCIQCPYHGWEFKKGIVSNVPGCPEFKAKNNIGVPQFMVKEINNDIYLCPTYDINSGNGFYPLNNDIHIPNESTDRSFRRISGKKRIKRPHKLITENVLDMMHISFVHSFGSRLSPVPFDVRYYDVSEFSGKTKFHYTSGYMSLSSILGKSKFVKVENEFHLPDTTVTRVIANDITKTIVTHCYPVSTNESILHYDLYRDFLTNPIFDYFFEYQMEVTLNEDISILNNVYDSYIDGFIHTKYDVTQIKYREKLKKNNNTLY